MLANVGECLGTVHKQVKGAVARKLYQSGMSLRKPLKIYCHQEIPDRVSGIVGIIWQAVHPSSIVPDTHQCPSMGLKHLPASAFGALCRRAIIAQDTHSYLQW